MFAHDDRAVHSHPSRCALGDRSGMTLIEALVSMVLLSFVVGFTCLCLSTTMTLFHSRRDSMRVQEMGQLFVARLESDLRGAVAVEADKTGDTIAFRASSGDDLAYVYLNDERKLTRHVRSSDGSTRSESVFPDRLRVESCAFSVREGYATVCMSLVRDDKRIPAGVNIAQSFQGCAALHVAESPVR